MIVIADTTPLISLMKINKLVLLTELFGYILIPEAVYHELTKNPSFKNEAEEIKNCKYIHVVCISSKKTARILRTATGLDIGESEAIVLVDEQNGNLLLVDEIKGRNVARQMGIKIMGTIGILLIALEKQLVTYTEITESVEILKNSGRHIKKELYETLLDTARKYKEK